MSWISHGVGRVEDRAFPLYKGEVTFLPEVTPPLSDWIGFKQKDGLLASGKRKGVPPKDLVSILNSEKKLKEKKYKNSITICQGDFGQFSFSSTQLLHCYFKISMIS